MESLPVENSLQIFLHLPLNEFYKMSSVSKQWRKIVEDNSEFLIRYFLQRFTLFGLIEQALDVKSYSMLYALLWYFRERILDKFPLSEESHSVLGERILDVSLCMGSVDLLRMFNDLKDVFAFQIGKLSVEKTYKLVTNPELLKIYQEINDQRTNFSPYFELVYSNGHLSFDQAEHLIGEYLNEMSYYTDVIFLIKFLIKLDIPELISVVLRATPASDRRDKTFYGVRDPVMYYRDIYQNLPDDFEIMDYLVRRMPQAVKELTESWPRAGPPRYEYQPIEKGFWKWKSALLLSILKYGQENSYTHVGIRSGPDGEFPVPGVMDREFWLKWSEPDLYFGLYRMNPNHYLLKVIREGALNKHKIIYTENIPIPVLLDYLRDSSDTRPTFHSRGDNEEYIAQLNAIRNVKENFGFFGDFEVRLRVSRSVQELYNFLRDGSICDIGRTYDKGQLEEFGKEFQSFRKTLPREYWDYFRDLWRISTYTGLLDYVIRTDQIGLYKHLDLNPWYLVCYERDEIYIPPPFRSLEMENLYLEDCRGYVQNFISRTLDRRFLENRGIVTPVQEEVGFDDWEEESVGSRESSPRSESFPTSPQLGPSQVELPTQMEFGQRSPQINSLQIGSPQRTPQSGQGSPPMGLGQLEPVLGIHEQFAIQQWNANFTDREQARENEYINELLWEIYRDTTQKLFRMGDLNPESYWWFPYLSQEFRETLF